MRFTHNVGILTIAGALIASGCSGDGDVARKPRKSKPVEPVNAPVDPPEEKLPVPSTEVEEAAPDSAADQSEQPIAPAAETAEAVPELPKVRLLLLTSAGPLIADFVITVDGRAYDEPIEDLLNEVLAAADTDGDGRATWSELTASPRFIYGQFGNQPVGENNQPRAIEEGFDTNKNGVVDRDEIPRLLNQNAAGRGAFWLADRGAQADDPRRRAPIKLLLDRDRDGRISLAEATGASRRLKSLDADDDETLLAIDLLTNAETNMMPERGASGPPVAVAISDAVDWRQLQYSLEEMYGFGGAIDRASLRQFGSLFDYLDENADGALTSDEFKRLAVAPPNVVAHATFGEKQTETEGNASGPVITLSAIGRELQSAKRDSRGGENSLSLRTAGVSFEFTVQDGMETGVAAQVEALFSQYDADGNGYLDSDESPDEAVGQAPFEAIDEDGDGKLFPEELLKSLRRRTAIARSQVRAAADLRRDPLFAQLDSNGDGRLGTREIANAAVVLKQLDSDGDDLIEAAEIPLTISLRLYRGNPPAGVPPMDYASQSVDESLPAWFVRMDANGDGEISPREFLGEAEQFELLDDDEDGFIEPAEISKINSSPAS